MAKCEESVEPACAPIRKPSEEEKNVVRREKNRLRMKIRLVDKHDVY